MSKKEGKKENSRLRRYCESKDMDYISNSNINGSFLKRGRLHSDKKDFSIFHK